MNPLAPEESRKLLDAMGVPVVMLRDRPAAAPASPQVPEIQREAEPAPKPIQPVETTQPRRLSELATPGSVTPEPSSKEDTPVSSEVLSSQMPSTTASVEALRFTLVSVITADAMLFVELPDWASGLLDGRLTAVCSDILRLATPRLESADWQYFHWPIEGIADHSTEAATEAVDAWLHRRWAEMEAVEPRILTSIQSLDGSTLTADACFLPPLVDLVSNPDAKRAAWQTLKMWLHADSPT